MENLVGISEPQGSISSIFQQFIQFQLEMIFKFET